MNKIGACQLCQRFYPDVCTQCREDRERLRADAERVGDLDPAIKDGRNSPTYMPPSKEREARRAEEPSNKVHHYTVTGPIEPIHVIEQYGLGFRMGSALKYLLRADHKGQRDSDLEKAINFLWRERYGTWRP